MPDDARVHYTYPDAGGGAPNVVQAKATVRQFIRARDLLGLSDLVARVRAIADGAALMPGTKVESKVFSTVSNLIGNRPSAPAPGCQNGRLLLRDGQKFRPFLWPSLLSGFTAETVLPGAKGAARRAVPAPLGEEKTVAGHAPPPLPSKPPIAPIAFGAANPES
ncbi:hypothetical protein [Antarcticimicrobium sediminis]|uniref:Uncharacterized protein n=1 Tax=Antarcticimicrobium sediminis TaxID=2546227 RepID=A0A4V2Z713_9RHOB|nr:hypothetical protein [Antarcticimicrobium sediminis]TDE34776.1 hypothetical protein E1B25_18750 [Antarcticimicrobium sediminis]